MFVDTHCHLNLPAFTGGEVKIVNRARAAQVERLVVPGINIQTSTKAIEIALNNTDVYAAVGIHPHNLFRNSGEDVPQLVRDIALLAHEPKVVAIGEVGFDRAPFYESRTSEPQEITQEHLKVQVLAFQLFCQAAHERDKALVVHNRGGGDLLLGQLAHALENGHLPRTVLHCCEPDDKLLDFVVTHGLYIGVDGDVTYSDTKRAFIAKVPLTHLVLETDSPYLLPEPLKSQKKYPNTPANIPLIAQEVAKTHHTSLEEVAQRTSQNAQELFVWP